MTDLDTERPTSSGTDPASPPVRRSRSTGWVGRRRRTTGWFAGATLVFVGLLGLMLWQGWETAKEVKGANRLEQQNDPSAPGFQAEVRPTPTRLVAQLDADGGLADMVLLVEGAGGVGGSAVFIPGTTAVDRGGEIIKLEDVYDQQGWPAVVDSADLLATAGALSVENPDAVVVDGPDGRTTAFEAGTVTLEPAQAVQFMTTVGVGESPLNRSFRQQLVWDAWFARLAELGEGARPDTAPLGTGEGAVDLAEVVTSMAQGYVSSEPIPLLRVPVKGENGFAADVPEPEAIAELVPRIIPFPQSSYPGQRARVRVLNGTRTKDLELLAAAGVVRAGGQVVIIGNADAFGVSATTVEYHDPSWAADAQRIGEALGGITATESSAQTDAFDVTVTLGSDIGG
jgi:hypothetical protein